jgi:hypothetical protein
MFYRLPFPDLQVLEKLQERLRITADVVRFLEMVHEDLSHARAMGDLREGWVEHAKYGIKSKGVVISAKRSESIRLERNKTPTQSEIDEMLCFRWYKSSVKCI